MIQLIHLDTVEKQSTGYMHCQEIATHYGLFFPNCGDSAFHMHTLGESLLMIGIDDKNRIQALEVREPETEAKKLKTQVPIKHVIEMSVRHKPHFEIGDRVKLEDYQ